MQEALENYDKAISLDPNDASSFVNKANLLANDVTDFLHVKEALKCYDIAMKIDPI